jgi:nitrogen fixation protein FixH
MINRLPSHIFWPGFVTFLLVFSVGWGVATVYFAMSDGGAQVVRDYSGESKSLKSKLAQKRQNESLGWAVDLRLNSIKKGGLRLRVEDKGGTPIRGLSGEVTLRRPHLSDNIAKLTFEETDKPGEYRASYEFREEGLWDFRVEVGDERGDYLKTFRREIQP